MSESEGMTPVRSGPTEYDRRSRRNVGGTYTVLMRLSAGPSWYWNRRFASAFSSHNSTSVLDRYSLMVLNSSANTPGQYSLNRSQRRGPDMNWIWPDLDVIFPAIERTVPGERSNGLIIYTLSTRTSPPLSLRCGVSKACSAWRKTVRAPFELLTVPVIRVFLMTQEQSMLSPKPPRIEKIRSLPNSWVPCSI